MDDIRKPNSTEASTSSSLADKTVSQTSKPSPVKKTRKSRRGVSKIVVALLVLLLIALAAVSTLLYKQYRNTQAQVDKLSTAQGQQELNQTQINQLLGEMRQIILLPSDEDPVVATITDINALKDKEFYKDAQNGDRVVVFANAKKAYIYRPETKMIINVGAFSVSADEATQNQ